MNLAKILHIKKTGILDGSDGIVKDMEKWLHTEINRLRSTTSVCYKTRPGLSKSSKP